MPPIIIPPLIKLALGAIGAATAVHLMVREMRRVNAEIDRVSGKPVADPVARRAMPTLKRDPRTGDWRVT